MITFGEKLAEIREYSTTNAELGRKFEQLFMYLARSESDFGVSEIWRWAEWPDRERLTNLSGTDSGIDLVAKSITGEFIAIQCKCYDESHRLGKNELNSFFAFSDFHSANSDELRKVFTSQWVVSTCEWTKTANDFVSAQGKTFTRIDFKEYENVPFIESVAQGRKTRTPFPFQQDAIDNCIQALYHNGFPRGRLIMACGTGKTFVALKVTERLTSLTKNQLVLFLAPSIALVAQARREWLAHTRGLRPLVVCSDRTAGGKDEDISIAELKCRVTTDAKEIANFGIDHPDALRVVFCTYQSLQKVVDAQRDHGLPDFGLTIADEAHRTTGIVRETGKNKVNFQLMHDDVNLRTDKRIYMTATERVYDLASTARVQEKGLRVVDMGGENADIYGPPLYRIGFREAVEEERLSEYRVVVLGVNEGSVTPSLRRRIDEIDWEGKVNTVKPTVRELVRVLGTSLAVNGVYKLTDELEEPEPLRKVLAFSNTIPRSKWYSAAMELSDVKRLTTRRMKDGSALKMRAQHIDGSASAMNRFNCLNELDNAQKNGETYIVNNVKLFTEGVDVPSLDAVVFLDPRDSQVDVVQAVGRVMRRAPGKRYGYIIVPVILGADGDWLSALESSPEGYNTIGRVLRALQAHDSRLAEEPEKLVFVVDPINGGGNGGGEGGGEQEELGLPLADSLKQVEQHIFAKVVASSNLGKPGKLVADQISQAVKFASSRFRQSDCVPALAEKLDITLDEKNLEVDLTAVATIAALLLCNACLMHKRLKSTVPDMRMIVSLDKLNFSTDPINELLNQWTTILEVDYLPIFAPAIAILQTLREGGFTYDATHDAIRPLIECANRVADSLSEMGFDHAGPLYHSILPTGQSDGAFYTNNLSALMLARLTLSKDYIDWSDMDAVRSLKIMDPACGTGTLLMAVCKTIKDRVAAHGKGIDSQDLHKLIVENVVAGLDINHHAVQLAASNLTLGAPTVDYARINVARMPHGTRHDLGHMQLGSIELLDMKRSNSELTGIAHDFSDVEDIGGVAAANENFDFPVGDLDVVIMNPPFTNNVKRGAKFAPEVRDAMRDREREVKSIVGKTDSLAASAIEPNALRSFFTPLADRLADARSGTFAEVMPTTALAGTSGTSERELLTQRFHVETVVTSHDLNHPNFSYNTDITESLLVCRRKGGSHLTTSRFVNLTRIPQSLEEAIDCIEGIESGDIAEWGSSIEWPRERLENDDFRACLFVNETLAQISSEFAGNSVLVRDVFKVASELGNIEPAGRRVQDAFVKVENGGDKHYSALWNHKSNRQQFLSSEPDTSITPRKGKEQYCVALGKAQSVACRQSNSYDKCSGRQRILEGTCGWFGVGAH